MHGSQTLQPISVRILVALAAMFDFKIWSTDVKLAYLQAYEPLQRKVYIGEPAVEFDLDEDMALQLLKLLYGLSDSGDLWYKTLDTHKERDLKMIPQKSILCSTCDPILANALLA